MAKTGIKFELSDDKKEAAFLYVKASGFYKKRLANYLMISRPTLDRIFKEDKGFFTRLKAADAEFCNDLIVETAKKKPWFILERKYRDEFGPINKVEMTFDPQAHIKEVIRRIEERHN